MKHFRHKKLLIILAILILAFLIFLVYMVVHEQRRHDQLSSSIDALQISLKQHGIKAERSTGCGRPYAEIGRGYKSCSITLTAQHSVSSVEDADLELSEYAEGIDDSGYFRVLQKLPKTVIDRDNLPFGSGGFRVKKSGQLCTARYSYEKENESMRFSFSCDDTSWFVRTFENIL